MNLVGKVKMTRKWLKDSLNWKKQLKETRKSSNYTTLKEGKTTSEKLEKI